VVVSLQRYQKLWMGADMGDPRLNSVHLENPRREIFRRAREELLGARGDRTLNLAGARNLPDQPHQTIVHREADANAPEGTDFWLLDKAGTYALKVGVNTIGRLPDNDVVLAGEFVSRRHCAILVHASNGCEVYDIASKNGTFINGAKLSGPMPLAPGDQIRMCDREVVFMSRCHNAVCSHPDTTDLR
jgi:hypothetical protein